MVLHQNKPKFLIDEETEETLESQIRMGLFLLAKIHDQLMRNPSLKGTCPLKIGHLKKEMHHLPTINCNHQC